MDNNLQIFDQNGRIITDNNELNKIIRDVEEEEGINLGAVIPAITFEEEDPDKKNIVYAYLIPIKEKYRAYNKNLIKKYIVKERSGDLTYERMTDAINAFIEGNYCSKNLEKYIKLNRFLVKMNQ